MSQPLISVIIPTYNKGLALVKTLEALQQQTVPFDQFEVLTIDDGSTDRTEAIIAQFCPSFEHRFVRQENLGAGRARNHGAELAHGDILVFLDSDIVLYPETLLVHLHAQQQLDRTLIVSRILPMNPNPNGLEDLFFQETMDFGPDEQHLTWKHTITQCLSIKKQHFLAIGGFDTSLRRCQDIDFGYRAEQLGFGVRYLPQARAWHNHSLSLDQRCTVERRNQQGFAALFQKYPGLSDQMPHLVDKAPINWQADTPALMARKCVRSLLATKPVRTGLRLSWRMLVRTAAPKRLLRSLYWKIVSSYQLLGYREGLRALSENNPG